LIVLEADINSARPRRRVWGEVGLAKGRAWQGVTGLAFWENGGLKRRQNPPVSAAIFPETCVGL
jgi:hypothetical protein